MSAINGRSNSVESIFRFFNSSQFFNTDHKVVHNIRPTFEGDPLLLWTILNLREQNLRFFVIFLLKPTCP